MAETKKTIEITDQNFEDVVLKSDKPVIVDFWAEWCGPCVALAPIIEELADDYDGKVVVGKLNVDQNSQAPIDYGIRSIPAIYIFKNGEVVDKQIGNAPKNVLQQKLEGVV